MSNQLLAYTISNFDQSHPRSLFRYTTGEGGGEMNNELADLLPDSGSD